MWLLRDQVFNKLQAAVDQGREATREEAIEIAAFIGWAVSDIYTVSGKSGVINVAGVLTQEPDPFSAVFGDSNTTYEAIQEALAEAEADANVEEIIFAIDSPGGAFKGMLETMELIANAKKPTVAQVIGTATSAAYGLAASTDRVEAMSKTAQFGSVGVVADFRIDASRVSLTNTGSPNKRPDAGTHAGQAIIRGELDAAFDLFAEGIAAKRGISPRNVAETYGRGGTYFADQAFKMGMVDSLTYTSQNAGNTTAPRRAPGPYLDNNNQHNEATMDLKELEAKHPELLASIVATTTASVKAAIAAEATPAPATQASADDSVNDVEKERSRVNALLHMGKESGDMKTALAAIESGEELTAELTSKFLMAAAKNTAIEARGGDEGGDDLDGVDDDDAATKDKKAEEGILSAVKEQLNIG